MNRIIKLLSLLLILFGFSSVVWGSQQKKTRPYREHEVYFENTPNELNVYRLYGRFDGNTAFILGGIQGDEPGGFMSADLYPNLVLERGNLIVIPRANFESIIHNNRGVNGDMNRRFDKDLPKDIDDRIVEIIKGLMGEADIFLNLHDGWGYFRPEYVDSEHNPHRFGQSVIADARYYVAHGDTIHLEEMATQVIRNMNKKIMTPEYQYHFMNTKTPDPKSDFPEMRVSATFFALTEFDIPAFGIETSKNLPNLEMKIRFHNYAINEFLKLMNIEPEHPAILYEPPKLIYLLISINHGPVQLVNPGQTIDINSGDLVTVQHIESNYQRGLSCDIQGMGNDNDLQKPMRINKSTTIIVRKDHSVIGQIPLAVDQVSYNLMTYIFEVNGRKKAILNNQSLEVHRGDKIKIIDVLFDGSSSSDFTVNLKGYVPPTDYNNGEDRNYLIDVSQLQWDKYSLHGKGKIYPVVVYKGNHPVSSCFISIQ